MLISENSIETPFTCVNPDNLVIRGFEMHATERTGRLPAVICCHGFTGDLRGTRPYAQKLAAQGYRAFIFDFCGGGYQCTSDGSFEDYMTPMTEVGDLRSVISYVRSREDVDPDRVALLGCSQGGFVSALVAAQQDTKISALFLMYPALCIPDDARKGSMQAIRFDPAAIPDHIGQPPMRVCGEYARCVLDMDIFDEIRGYHGPVLIEHGTADAIVPVRYARRAQEVYAQNGNIVLLYLLRGAGHGFEGNCFEEAAERLKMFAGKYFPADIGE